MWAAATGLAAFGMMTLAAVAAPGQCTVTGFETFECDVALDGGGLTFALPDGSVLAFALTGDAVGVGYLVAADAKPGQQPQALGEFRPAETDPGCWSATRRDFEFCVLVAQ